VSCDCTRLSELQEAACRQLLSTDPQLQSAGLRCLSSFRLPFLAPHLLNFLLSLADITKLRSALVYVPMMLDTSAAAAAAGREAEEQQQRQQQQQLKGKKGNSSSSSDVGRVDAAVRPGDVTEVCFA